MITSIAIVMTEKYWLATLPALCSIVNRVVKKVKKRKEKKS